MLSTRLMSPVFRNLVGRRNMSAIGGPAQTHVPKGVSVLIFNAKLRNNPAYSIES